MQHAGFGAADCSGHGAVIDGLMLGQLGDMSEWANWLEACNSNPCSGGASHLNHRTLWRLLLTVNFRSDTLFDTQACTT